MNGTSPMVGQVNTPDGKVVVAGSIATLILNDDRTESRLFAGVPPLPKAFVGGDERLAELRGRITGGGVLALEGTPGVGKTALATALAWDADVLARFSGGVLWASLGPSPNADELLNRWAQALGIDVTQERTTEQRAAHIQSKLAGRSFLFVLDDAWQETPADLLCRIAAPGCAHLLTTRDHTIAARLASGKLETVKELPESHAITLLATLCPIAAQADEEALRRLAHAAGGLPLALTLIGGYLADNIAFRAEVPQVLQDLAEAKAWLGLEQRERRLTLAQIVELSITALPADVRQVFTRLAPFAAKPASFSLEAAQAVSGGTLAALGTLVRRNLLEKLTEERVAMHAVVAACAQEHASGDGALADRHARYYLDWASQDPSAWRRIEAEWAQIQQGWRWVVRNRDEGTLAYTQVLWTFLRLRGLWRDALSWHEKALAAARRLEQRGTEAMLLNNVGLVYNDLGERQRALEFYEQALPIRREVGERAGEAVTLNNIGLAYDNLGERQRALEFYEQALPIRREVGDRAGEAMTLNNIGVAYDNQGERQRALEFYEQALPIQREVGDRAGEAATLNNIGLAYDNLGERQRALELYEQALLIRREVGDRAGEAVTLNNIGSAYNNLGERQRALEFYKQALPIQREVGDRAGEAATLNNIGSAYNNLGERQRALELYEQALPIRREVGDRAGEAATLNNIGVAYDNQGERQRALEFYEQALSVWREVGDRAGEAVTLNNIGSTYDKLAERQRALEFYEQALPIQREVGDRAGEAATLNNIGSTYDKLGERQRALEFYEQALSIQREVGDRAGEAVTLNNIGSAYNNLGERQRALEFYEQALSVWREVGDRAGEAATLNNIGSTYDKLGERQRALEFYEQALPVWREVGDRAGEAVTLFNMARVYETAGDLQRAVQLLEQTVAIDEAIARPDLKRDRAVLNALRQKLHDSKP